MLEAKAIVKTPVLPFFVRTAKPTSGVEFPVDVNVPVAVFTQADGLTTQAGIVKVVASALT